MKNAILRELSKDVKNFRLEIKGDSGIMGVDKKGG